MNLLSLTMMLSILFWGWQHDMIPVALCILAVPAGRLFIKTRWAFDDQSFNKISDFSTLVVAGSLVYFLINEPKLVIIRTVSVLPLTVLPVLAAQLYSASDKISITSLMLFSGKNRSGDYFEEKKIDFSYPYIIICILSAGMGLKRGDLFYISIVCFSFLLLFPLRSKRYSIVTWFLLFTIPAVSGYFIHKEISRLQRVLTQYTINYLASRTPDPLHQTTSIGQIGRLKLSNRIVSRVQKKNNAPIYLRLSSYTSYQKGQWFATRSSFTDVRPAKNKKDWILNKNTDETDNTLILNTTIGNTWLPELPDGTVSINNLEADKVEKNTLGVVRVTGGKGFTACNISYNSKVSNLRPPGRVDKRVPETIKKTIETFIEELNRKYQTDLNQISSEEKLKILKNHFTENFIYSLTQKKNGSKEIPLANFLLKTRTGHCEFYATTTVFLLRALDLPARYVTGYLAHDYQADVGLFIVRERDAHAWSTVYINGKWTRFDTTPPNWIDYEREKNETTPVKDFISYCRFIVLKWFSEHTREEILYMTAVVSLPLTAFLLFRLRPSKRVKRIKSKKRRKEHTSLLRRTGFYLLEEKLNERGFYRNLSETYRDWFERIKLHELIILSEKEIKESLLYHYSQQYGQKKNNQSENDAIDNIINRGLKNSHRK